MTSSRASLGAAVIAGVCTILASIVPALLARFDVGPVRDYVCGPGPSPMLRSADQGGASELLAAVAREERSPDRSVGAPADSAPELAVPASLDQLTGIKDGSIHSVLGGQVRIKVARTYRDAVGEAAATIFVEFRDRSKPGRTGTVRTDRPYAFEYRDEEYEVRATRIAVSDRELDARIFRLPRP